MERHQVGVAVLLGVVKEGAGHGDEKGVRAMPGAHCMGAG